MQNLTIVLVSSRNPLNIGAVARAMSNFGATCLRVVHPYEKAFREARSAVGAATVLQQTEEFPSVEQAVADCSLVIGTTAIGNREIKHPIQSLDKAAPILRKKLSTQRVAILFGSEKKGLSNEDLSYCHWLLHIPTRTEHLSMNLGQAAAVVLYDLARGNRTLEEGVIRPPARMETVERITESWLACLKGSGYIAKRGEGLAEEKLRRMVRRLAIAEADAEVILGMFRKIKEELQRGK